MLYYSLIDISEVDESCVFTLCENIKRHFKDISCFVRKESACARMLLCDILFKEYSEYDFLVDNEENGKPYIVFCHEWVQCKNGEICAQELSSDLSTPIGEPFLLFKATENPHVSCLDEEGSGNYVTDGPFLWKKEGKWKMIWSSFQKGKGYAVFGATAESLHGKWEHTDNLVDFNGGHGMLFETFDGVLKLALHAPNSSPNERAQFIDWKDRF